MAEEEKKDEKAGEEAIANPAAAGGKKKIMIIGGAVGLVLVIALGAFFMLKPSGSKSEKKDVAGEKADGGEAGKASDANSHAEGGEEKKEGGEEKKAQGEGKSGAAAVDPNATNATSSASSEDVFKFGQTYTLPAFNLNLGNPIENRYIRLEIALEFKGGDSQKKEIDARLPQLRDAVVSVTSRKTREFLLGPDGKDQLRLELLNRINEYMEKKIDAVYITDLLIE